MKGHVTERFKAPNWNTIFYQGHKAMMKGQKSSRPRIMPVWWAGFLAALIILGTAFVILVTQSLSGRRDFLLATALGGPSALAMIFCLVHIWREERDLLKEQNILRALIDNLPDRIYFKGIDGRKIISNLADWQASGGNKMEDVIGKTDFDTYPPELAAKFWADDKAVIESEVPITNREERALDPQGKQVWTLATKVPLRDERGKLMGLVGISRDITAYKKSADAVKDAEERYRHIFEDSVEGIYQTTADGKIITLNPALARMLGYSSPADMIASITDIDRQFYVAPSRRDEFKHQVETDGVVSGFESQVYRRDGSKIWISENGRAVRDKNGDLLYYEGTTIDITDRKLAEDAQRKVEEKYHSFFENSIAGMFQTTLEGKFLAANPVLAKMLGYDSPEDLMTSITDLARQLYVNPSSRAEFVKRLEEDGGVSGFETELSCKNGSTIWVQLNALAMEGDHSRPAYYEGSVVDITAHKQIEQTQEEARQKQAVWISELEQHTREISLLNEMSNLLQSCPTLDEAYDVISQRAQWLFPEESGALFVLSSSRNIMESVAIWGPSKPGLPTFKPNDCWAFRRGRLHVVEFAQGSNKPLLYCPHVQSHESNVYVCVPLIAQGDTVGILHLCHDVKPGSDRTPPEIWYTEARQQFTQTVADALALSISNLKLRESLRQQSIRDPLTGIFNRRYMEESLEREIARAKRDGQGLGVIMLDIDHFKHFNDMFGHEAGDAVLCELGAFFRSHIRAADIACRYGGEEFALIIPGANLETTRLRAETIREGIKHLQVKNRGRLIGSVTISLGISEFPAHGSTGEILIRNADAALYQAKKTGRDRVVIHQLQKAAERSP